MPLITKPDFTYVWASGGAVVAPNDAKKQTGWVAEAPPFQYDNWLQNRQDQMLAHINQRGIPAWDGLTNYEAGGLSYVQGSDGKVYKSVAASGPSSVVSNPTTDGTDTYWTIAFADVGAFLTQAAGDTRYTQRSNNLSDLTNVATARTNLGAAPVVSPAFTGTPTAPTASAGTNTTQVATTAFVVAAEKLNAPIATVAAAGTINLTTGAPNTSQLAISGTGVNINGFTVAANRFFVVKMTGATNTLVNSASLVTGSGANIKTAAGDSFLMLSTAANTVEIVGYTLGVDFTIIYPNGGNVGSPANITTSSRYIEANPFPGFLVRMQLQVLYLGEWGDLKSAAIDGNAGGSVGADIYQVEDNLRLVTGSVALLPAGASRINHGFATPGTNQSTLPCRVIVWKVKGATA